MGQARDEAGNIWETDAQGNPVRLLQAAGAPEGQVFSLPPDSVEQARLGIAQSAESRAQSQAGLREELLRAQIRKAEADAAKAEQGTAGAATGDAKLQARLANINALVDQINRVQELYQAGPGSTEGLKGLADFFPTSTNKQFDAAAAGLAEQGLAAFRVPGVGAQSDTELRQFVQANRPSASDFDAEIEEKLRQLRNRVDKTRQSMGLPPAEWQGAQTERDDRPNAMAIPRIVSGSGPTAAGFGATEGGQPVPPGYQQAYEAFVRTGNFTPDQYAAFRQQLDQQFFGEAAPQTDTYREEGARILETLQRGGDLNLTVPPTEAPLSDLDQLRNNVAANPLGAALIGAADMGSLGGVSALAPGQMQALGDAGGWTGAGLLAGQIGGAIGGTAAIGRLGKETLGRIAPKLLGGGKVAQFGRNLAEDVAYSGVYGTTTGQDPLATAAQGGAGSVLGQGMGSALGRAVSGVTSSPTISRLRDLGVTPSLGQIMRGRAADNNGRSMVAGIEDVIANNGAVGTFVNNARGRALEDANLAGFNIVSDGRPVTAIGEQGLDQLDTIKTDAYSDALSGVSVPTNDPRFVGNVASAARMGEAVDAARGRGDFTYIMDNELAPILGVGPNYSGDQLQDALRLLQGQSRAYRKAASGAAPDPAAAGVSRALDKVGDALGDLASTYSPDTLPKLQSANAIYRGLQVLDDASGRAMNEGGVWTAAQLGQAIKANTQAFEGKGLRKAAKSPLYQLQQDMQAVLPNKVPPTGVNAAPMLALGGAALGGAGYATDNDALKYAALLGLAAAPYTKAGQKAVAKALLDRPDKVKELGKAIRKKKGLFGSATLPFTLPQ